MNSNRGQYSFTPMYNMKNKRDDRKKETDREETLPAAKRYAGLSVILSLVLPALFVAALLLPNAALRWVFLGAALVSVLAMWVLRAFVRSARNTLTVIYAALAVVIGLALFINRQTPESRAAAVSATRASQAADAGSVSAPTAPPETEATPVPEPEAYTRLKEFLAAWSTNAVSVMKSYCLPSWVSAQKSPETELFQMLSRSRPVSYVDALEQITGSEGDSSRILTMKVYFSENGGTVLKRMQVIMNQINGIWYVDPSSLGGVVVDEAAEAAAAANEAVPRSTVTPSPLPTNEEDVLYVWYNVNGGKKYHLNRTCDAVSSEYWPLTGKIPFDLINSAQYSKLIPCEKCAAPTRPPVVQ